MNAIAIPATALEPAYLIVELGEHQGFEANPMWLLVGFSRTICTTQLGGTFERVDLIYVAKANAPAL